MFSIATISYNQASFLEQAIVSVTSQLQPEDEYFVLDGGSSDGSDDIIRKHAGVITRWRSAPDRGPAAALNEAVALAGKPFFLYINADDFLLPGRLQRLRDYIGENSGFDVYYGDGITFDAPSGKITRRYSDRWNARSYARGFCSVVQQSTVLRTEMMRKVGGFCESNRTCWDGELLFDVSAAGGRFRKIPFEVGVFRIHEGSITGSATNLESYVHDRKRIASRMGVRYTTPGARDRSVALFSRLRRPDQLLGRVACRLKDMTSCPPLDQTNGAS